MARGSSAHRQLAALQKAKDAGKDVSAALRDVVQMLREDTVYGL
jgi:hypothetical protein